ncbi:MAG: glycosyltransferase family 4 protein [Anaerolineales bacterium]
MRVLYLSRGGNPHDRRFLTALAETEHSVFFLPMEASASSERKFVPGKIEILDLPGMLNPIDLGEVLERIRPDLVHAGPIQGGAYLTAQAGWHPLVSMSWGSDLLVDAQSGEGRDRAEYALRASDILVCDCQTVREAAIRLGMPGERIVVFPWGVDLKRFSPGQDGGLRDRLGWQDKFVILSARAWEPLYGVDLIVKAFIKTSEKDPSLRLLMLGQGSLRAELLTSLERAGLSDRIHAPGTMETHELPTYYRASDLYVSASHSDGTSISLLESMACGLPAIVSDIPANQEWVVPEGTGWWFQDGNEADLSDAIVESVAYRERLHEMGNRARKIAEDRGDWQENFKKLLDAYEMAISLAQLQQ